MHLIIPLIVRRLLPALLAVSGALSTPATALAHGVAHHHESVAHAGAVAHADAVSDMAAHAPVTGSRATVGCTDESVEHSLLHQLVPALRVAPAIVAPPPAQRLWHSQVLVERACAPAATAIVPHASPPLPALAQPRAPPLG